MITLAKLNSLLLIILLFFTSCTDEPKEKKDVVLITATTPPNEIHIKMESEFQDALNTYEKDSTVGPFRYYVLKLYKQNGDSAIWTNNTGFLTLADSLISLLNKSHEFGLLPEDYQVEGMIASRESARESSASGKVNLTELANADILFTSAFIHFIKDVRIGRLIPDKAVVKDSILPSIYFNSQLDSFKTENSKKFIAQLEVNNTEYLSLKAALHKFLKKADLTPHQFINFKDSFNYQTLIYSRLLEEDTLKLHRIGTPDSLALANAIKKYQKFRKLNVTGKITPLLINQLNYSDFEKFLIIGLNLDRYKEQQQFPAEYILVNLPAFNLQVKDSDSIKLTSRIICGKPKTNTPEISSFITNLITYPQWTIPPGIIKKEVLPALKQDPGYIYRKGFTVIDAKGNEVDPYSVKWSKYKEEIPYDIIQGSGDENALGVLKFNFPNEYFIYLHDTNQRYLFKNSKRALSHGCVRVQEWKKLADYLLTRDSITSPNATSIDSLNSWLLAKKKKQIIIRNKMPVFIRYYTCAVVNNNLRFYEDIYGEDSRLRNILLKNISTTKGKAIDN